MRLTRPKTRARLTLTALCLFVLAFTGNCTLGPLQAFLFHFTLDDAVEVGKTEDVHRAFYPVAVGVKKHWVRISGYLDTKGAELPSRVAVTIEGEDQTTGKRNQKINLNLSIQPDGSFTATKKIRKNIPAGTVQSISARPTGAELPAGAEVWACIDIAEKKGDLAPASDCNGGNTGETPTADMAIVEVLDDAFEPKSLVIRPGDTVRWVLRGNRGNHTTNEMNATWQSGFVFSENGDFFEHTFSATDDGTTFLYFCATHQGCCEMQGSIRVGAGAPPPDDGY